MSQRVIQPDGWAPPRGYSNGIAAQGTVLAIAGQVGWDPRTNEMKSGFIEQVRQALENVAAVLKAAGAEPTHLIRMTWYITDRQEYAQNTRAIGEVYRAVMGRHYPAMTLVIVAGLLEDGAKVEIEATAVVEGLVL